MEKIIRFKPRVQEAKAVTPDKGEVAKAPDWGERIHGPPIVQPWTKASRKGLNKSPETVREIWVRNPESDKERFPLEHLDARWARTVYWSEREKTYKPRDPTKPVPWIHTPNWKPETDEDNTSEKR